jgi:IS4 transposase
VEGLRARTTSKSHALRLLYFYYALILYNAWLLSNLIIAKRFSKILEAPIIEM